MAVALRWRPSTFRASLTRQQVPHPLEGRAPLRRRAPSLWPLARQFPDAARPRSARCAATSICCHDRRENSQPRRWEAEPDRGEAAREVANDIYSRSGIGDRFVAKLRGALRNDRQLSDCGAQASAKQKNKCKGERSGESCRMHVTTAPHGHGSASERVSPLMLADIDLPNHVQSCCAISACARRDCGAN